MTIESVFRRSIQGVMGPLYSNHGGSYEIIRTKQSFFKVLILQFKKYCVIRRLY